MATLSALKAFRSRGVGLTPVQIGGYSVPTNYSANINALRICNRILTQNITFSVYVQDASNNKTYLADSILLQPGQNFLLAEGNKDVLVEGESLWISASVASAIDVSLSVLEDTA